MEGQCKIRYLHPFPFPFQMSNFGFFSACLSLFTSLVNSSFSFQKLICLFPRQSILIQTPIDREILRLFQSLLRLSITKGKSR